LIIKTENISSVLKVTLWSLLVISWPFLSHSITIGFEPLDKEHDTTKLAVFRLTKYGKEKGMIFGKSRERKYIDHSWL
jgi:hypothetical protein